MAVESSNSTAVQLQSEPLSVLSVGAVVLH